MVVQVRFPENVYMKYNGESPYIVFRNAEFPVTRWWCQWGREITCDVTPEQLIPLQLLNIPVEPLE